VVALADGSGAAVELVLLLLAIEHPHSQGAFRQWLAGREIEARSHFNGLIDRQRGLAAPAAGDRGADGASDVMPAIEKFPWRDPRRVTPP
jgi:hypothetical protein